MENSGLRVSGEGDRAKKKRAFFRGVRVCLWETMRFPRFLLALIVVLAASVSSARAEPNVVIILTDDQGTLDAGCYGAGDLHTPNIDRIAAEGVRFTQAYAHTVCCPARAALLTGRHPQRGGVNSWTQGNMKGADGINMALEEVTLAEALGAAGYRTALFGKWHVGSHRDFGPMKQGFRRVLRDSQRVHRQLQPPLPPRYGLSRSLRGDERGVGRGRVFSRDDHRSGAGVHREEQGTSLPSLSRFQHAALPGTGGGTIPRDVQGHGDAPPLVCGVPRRTRIIISGRCWMRSMGTDCARRQSCFS